jgi:hypothetical protein
MSPSFQPAFGLKGTALPPLTRTCGLPALPMSAAVSALMPLLAASNIIFGRLFAVSSFETKGFLPASNSRYSST